MRPDRWTTCPWSPEERRALAGLGPAWRLARKATGEVACPTCAAEPWTRCTGGLHMDRLLAYAAHLRASIIAPPDAAAVQAVADEVARWPLTAGSEVRRAAVRFPAGDDRSGDADDAAFDLAIHHGLLRLATGPERWVLSDYGAECWSTS